MDELNTCTFCGHNASVYNVPVETTKFNPTFSVEGFGSLGYNTTKKSIKYTIRCNKCKAAIGPYATRKQAIESWNKRKEPNK